MDNESRPFLLFNMIFCGLITSNQWSHIMNYLLPKPLNTFIKSFKSDFVPSSYDFFLYARKGNRLTIQLKRQNWCFSTFLPGL